MIRFEESIVIFNKIMKKFLSKEFQKFSTFSNDEENYLIPEITHAFNIYKLTYEIKLNRQDITNNLEEFIKIAGDNIFLTKYLAEDNKILAVKRKKLIYKKPENEIICGTLKREFINNDKAIDVPAYYNYDLAYNSRYLVEAGIKEKSGISEEYIKLTDTIELNSKIELNPVILGDPLKCSGKTFLYKSEKKTNGIAEGFNDYFNKVIYNRLEKKFFIDKRGIYIKVETTKKIELLKSYIEKQKKLNPKKLESYITDQFDLYKDTFIYPELLMTIKRECIKILNGYQNKVFMIVYFTGENVFSIIQDKLTLFKRT